MATVITELAAQFGNLGFASVLIQRRVITRLQLDTVFWASMVLGVVLAAAVYAASYLSTSLFHSTLAGQILRVLCISFIIAELSVVHGALIVRSMRFHADFIIQILSRFGSAATAVICALQGMGVWSLVMGSLAAPIIKAVLSWLVVPYTPRLKFHPGYLRQTWKTNSSYLAYSFVNYANANIDTFLIGRTLGATVLGYYQNARSLTDEVRNRMAAPLQRVLFPAFSSLQGNTSWLQHSVLRSGRLLAAIVVPVGVGISAVAPELVPVLYGPKWLTMIPVLTMLGVSAALRASTAVAIPLYNAKNKVSMALRYNLIGTAILILSVWIAAPRGIAAVAVAVALSSMYGLVTFRYGLGLIGLGWKAAWSILGAPALASLMMWLSIMALRALLHDQVSSPMIMLLLEVSTGAFIYCSILFSTSKVVLSDFKAVLAKLRPSHGSLRAGP